MPGEDNAVTRESTSSLFSLAQPMNVTGMRLFWPILNTLGFFLGVTGLILEYGFVRYDPTTGIPVSVSPVSHAILLYVQYGAILCFIAVLLLKMIFLPNRIEFFKEHVVEIILSLGAVVGMAMSFPARHPNWLHLGLMIYLVILLLIVFVKFNSWLIQTIVYPARATLLGFALAIFSGALLLSLPCSTYSNRFTGFANNFVDNLFTATSAVCVTGLTVRDTASDFTPFGQLVILLLVQIGGLGIIIFGTVFSILLGRQVSLQETSLAMDIYSQRDAGQIRRVVKFIILFTLLIEAIGAAFMYSMWPGSDVGDKIYKSIFHSVSAFCNAGFTLQKDSLISLEKHWQIYGVIAPLILLGGIGFPVIANVIAVAKFRIGRFWRNDYSAYTGIDLDFFRMTRLNLQSKIVLMTTFLLIVSGVAIIFLLETPKQQQRWGRTVQYEDITIRDSQNVLRNHSWPQRLLDACFLSVSSRTAGFNSVEMESGKLEPGTFMTVISLMIIGGSPASTGGGIKTVTFALLLATIIATLRHRSNVNIYNRTIDFSLIRRALVVVLIFFTLVWTLTLALLLAQPQMPFMELLFESSSACATVGLSMGITPNLGLAGRLLLILGMFAGRLGPLTLLFAMAGRPKKVQYEYPSEALITG